MISSCYKHAADMNNIHYKGSLQSSGAPQVCKGKHAWQMTKISPRGHQIPLDKSAPCVAQAELEPQVQHGRC